MSYWEYWTPHPLKLATPGCDPPNFSEKMFVGDYISSGAVEGHLVDEPSSWSHPNHSQAPFERLCCLHLAMFGTEVFFFAANGKFYRESWKTVWVETLFWEISQKKPLMQKFPSTVKQPTADGLDSPDVIHMGSRSLSDSSFPCHDLGTVMCRKKSGFVILCLIDLIVTSLMSLKWSCYSSRYILTLQPDSILRCNKIETWTSISISENWGPCKCLKHQHLTVILWNLKSSIFALLRTRRGVMWSIAAQVLTRKNTHFCINFALVCLGVSGVSVPEMVLGTEKTSRFHDLRLVFSGGARFRPSLGQATWRHGTSLRHCEDSQ